MGPSQPITLNGQEHMLRYSIRNTRLATSVLQGYLPAGTPDKLDIGRAAQLIQRGDQDAIIVFLHAGLTHENERLTQQQIERWCERHVEGGGELGDFVLPILDALRAGGHIRVNYRTTVPDEEGANGAGSGPLREVPRAEPRERSLTE